MDHQLTVLEQTFEAIESFMHNLDEEISHLESENEQRLSKIQQYEKELAKKDESSKKDEVIRKQKIEICNEEAFDAEIPQELVQTTEKCEQMSKVFKSNEKEFDIATQKLKQLKEKLEILLNSIVFIEDIMSNKNFEFTS